MKGVNDVKLMNKIRPVHSMNEARRDPSSKSSHCVQPFETQANCSEFSMSKPHSDTAACKWPYVLGRKYLFMIIMLNILYRCRTQDGWMFLLCRNLCSACGVSQLVAQGLFPFLDLQWECAFV